MLVALLVALVIIVLIYVFDINPGLRTKELRGLIDELNKFTANGSGQMTWHMAEAPGLGSERSLSCDLVYTWHSDDVQIEVVLQQRNKVFGITTLTLGGRPMPIWEYGPGKSKKLNQLLPELRQVLGDSEIKVVAPPAAA